MPVQEVINHIQSQADSHFDPAVVKDFLEMIKDDQAYVAPVGLDDKLPGLERGMVEALP